MFFHCFSFHFQVLNSVILFLHCLFFFLAFFRGSIHFLQSCVFSCLSLRDLFISSLRTSIIFTEAIFLCFSDIEIFHGSCSTIVRVWWCHTPLAVLCFYTGIEVRSDCRSKCQFLCLSSLDECFVPWFLFPFWSSGLFGLDFLWPI